MWITRIRAADVPYALGMHWDRLFADLEGQLASEWEAERAALDAESERLRIAKLALRERLRVLARAQASARIALPGASAPLRGRIDAVGADWLGVLPADGGALSLLRLDALHGIELDHGLLLESLEESRADDPGIGERMSFGFVVRDLARRRLPLRIGLVDGSEIHGTVDRASADHLDLAVHESGQPRRSQAVTAYRILPFTAIARLTMPPRTR